MAESDSLRLTSIFLGALIRTCITTTRHPSVGFQKLLPTQRDIEKVFLVPGLSIAPNLLAVLRASDPPTLAWFKGLPFCETSKDWAVYTLILEKPNSKPLLYIGSATNRSGGLRQRMNAYRTHQGSMASLVARALKEGFVITYKGVLLTMPCPGLAEVPLHRHFIFALEATLSFAFWAMYSREKDYRMGHLCKWDKETLEWHGLCNHSALYDYPLLATEELDMTPEELETLALERKAHRSEVEKALTQKYLRERKYVCTPCDKAFRTSSQLESHLTSHGSIRKHLCTLCPASYKRASGLSNHRKDKHSASPVDHVCVVCGSRYGSRRKLLRHQSRNHSIAPPILFECTDCGGKFKNEDCVARHKRLKHGPSPIKFTCSSCNKEYSSKYLRDQHFAKEHTQEPPKYVCTICERAFDWKTSLSDHMKRFHDPSRPRFSCKGCERDFDTKVALDQHYARRHDPSRPRFSCKGCARDFKTKVALDQHYARYHSQGPTTHACTFCEKTFGQRRYLLRHIRLLHSKSPASYPCSGCSKVYKSKYARNQHFAGHHGQEPPKLTSTFCDE